MSKPQRVGYFSMEIGLRAEIPTYSGGLGVLAGDTIQAAADLKIPMVAVTLLHRKGYCRQKLDDQGNQTEEPVNWIVEEFLEELPARAAVRIGGRDVLVRAWMYRVEGVSGFRIPVLFVDTDLPGNDEADRRICHHLYGGDERYRLGQEAVLGIGGVRLLDALGYDAVDRFHMNEGHASLLACELLERRLGARSPSALNDADLEAVRRQCVFTTHTPVPAGHDQFPLDVVRSVLDERVIALLRNMSGVDGSLNMTYLALHLSHFVNGVAKRHGEISRQMFANYSIDSITNGVHARTWVSPPFQELFDKHIATWREDSNSLRYAGSIANHEIQLAHVEGKRALLDQVKQSTGVAMDLDAFTIGFARRSAAYKRADLFFDDIDRLRALPARSGAIQVIYAGKAHPQDGGGKDVIRRIFQAKESVKDRMKVVYLADYDINLCKLMTAGVDLWLNTPEPPMEASGTSGMKAAMNGVPSLSVLDGWWVEGCIEGTTGWAIGDATDRGSEPPDRRRDAQTMYDKLEYVILPLFYRNHDQYVDVMRHCIALNGSFFNTQRMMHQYVLKAYFS